MVTAALATLAGPTVIAMPYGPAPSLDPQVAAEDDTAIFGRNGCAKAATR